MIDESTRLFLHSLRALLLIVLDRAPQVQRGARQLLAETEDVLGLPRTIAPARQRREEARSLRNQV